MQGKTTERIAQETSGSIRGRKPAFKVFLASFFRVAKGLGLSFLLGTLVGIGTYLLNAAPKKLSPLQPKSAQGCLTEEFNRRVFHNAKGRHVLFLDREETLRRDAGRKQRVARRLMRFLEEKGLFPFEREEVVEHLGFAVSVRADMMGGAGCLLAKPYSMLSEWMGREPPEILLVCSDPPGTTVAQTIRDVCLLDESRFDVATGLPFSDRMMERAISFHEVFGHGLDLDMEAATVKDDGVFMRIGNGELRGEIAKVLHMTQDTHATLMARAWAGMRTLGALNRVEFYLGKKMAKAVPFSNIYNCGQALESVIEGLEERLDDPRRAAEFFRMDDDALDRLADQEMARLQCNLAQYNRKSDILAAAVAMGRDGVTASGQQRCGSETRELLRRSPDLFGPAFDLLRRGDAAAGYLSVTKRGKPGRSGIRKSMPGPHPVPVPE